VKRTATMQRRIYHVMYRNGQWHVSRSGGLRSTACHTTQDDAVVGARQLAKRSAVPAQVVVHGRRGKILREWTYLDDPIRTNG
jgi:hypothetical protein